MATVKRVWVELVFQPTLLLRARLQLCRSLDWFSIGPQKIFLFAGRVENFVVRSPTILRQTISELYRGNASGRSVISKLWLIKRRET